MAGAERVFVGLGANLGDATASVRAALAQLGTLPQTECVAMSPLYRSVPVDAGGSAAIATGSSQPGDHVDLRAGMDVLAVISNCPQVLNPCNNFVPTPIQVTVLNAADDVNARR